MSETNRTVERLIRKHVLLEEKIRTQGAKDKPDIKTSQESTGSNVGKKHGGHPPTMSAIHDH